jgi:hypothetical protein
MVVPVLGVCFVLLFVWVAAITVWELVFPPKMYPDSWEEEQDSEL